MIAGRRKEGRQEKGRAALAGAALLAALLAIWSLWPVPYLEVEAGGTVVYRQRVGAGQVVALDYVHSVFHRPVREEFTVTPAGLVLTRIESTTPEIDGYYGFPRARLRRQQGSRGDMGDMYELAAGGEGLMPPARRLAVKATPVGRRTLVAGGRCYRLPAAPGGGQTAWITLRWRPRILGMAGAVGRAERGGTDGPCLMQPGLASGPN